VVEGGGKDGGTRIRRGWIKLEEEEEEEVDCRFSFLWQINSISFFCKKHFLSLSGNTRIIVYVYIYE